MSSCTAECCRCTAAAVTAVVPARQPVQTTGGAQRAPPGVCPALHGSDAGPAEHWQWAISMHLQPQFGFDESMSVLHCTAIPHAATPPWLLVLYIMLHRHTMQQIATVCRRRSSSLLPEGLHINRCAACCILEQLTSCISDMQICSMVDQQAQHIAVPLACCCHKRRSPGCDEVHICTMIQEAAHAASIPQQHRCMQGCAAALQRCRLSYQC